MCDSIAPTLTLDFPEHIVMACRRASQGVAPVLLYGQSGVGKSHAARCIHQARKTLTELQILDCAVESHENCRKLLFGGYLSGETIEGGGLLGTDGGDLLLKHIHSMHKDTQRQFASALRDRLYRAHGDGRQIQVPESKFITATALEARDTESKLEIAGRDHAPWAGILGSSHEGPRPHSDIVPELLSELTCRIYLPALKTHKEHIPPLLKSFLEEERFDGRVSLRVIFLLQVMDYRSDNIRELRTAVRRAVANAGGADVLIPDHFGARILSTSTEKQVLHRPWPEKAWSLASEEERSKLPFRPVMDGEKVVNWDFDSVSQVDLLRIEYFVALLQLWRCDDKPTLDQLLALKPLGNNELMHLAMSDQPDIVEDGASPTPVADPRWYYTAGYASIITPEGLEIKLNSSQRPILEALNKEHRNGSMERRTQSGLLKLDGVAPLYGHVSRVFQKGRHREIRTRLLKFSGTGFVELTRRILPYDKSESIKTPDSETSHPLHLQKRSPEKLARSSLRRRTDNK